MAQEHVTYTFCCRRCQHTFTVTATDANPIRLETAKCPECGWTPLDSLGEPDPTPPRRRRKRGSMKFGGVI